VTEDQSA